MKVQVGLLPRTTKWPIGAKEYADGRYPTV
jgi:hypothetical protein